MGTQMEKKMDSGMESGVPLLVGWLVVLILISQLDNMLIFLRS